MNALGQRIARLIEAQGPLSIAQFMTIALHDPQAGYYSTRDPLGAGGDFITAPEISQMFGELLGLWMAQSWHSQGKPRARLVELGPGRGTLMADALRAARVMPEFLASIEVVLIEASPTLRDIQGETLKGSNVPVRWSPQFDDTLADLPLFVIANEFFDALPIRQFVRTEKGWCERMIGLDANGSLTFALAPEPSAIPLPAGNVAVGAVYETSSGAAALTQQIAEVIARNGGAALIVDYGYAANDAFGETLQAVGKHKFTGILDAPGDADLSAHVDFAALAQTAREAGAAAFGPVDQGDFLTALGIVQRAQRLSQAQRRLSRGLSEQPGLQRQLERLILPDQMGSLFKALAIVPNGAPTPAGF